MPCALIYYCFCLAKNSPSDAMRIFWEEPMGRVWQFIHCALTHNNQPVRFTSSSSDMTGLLQEARSDDQP